MTSLNTLSSLYTPRLIDNLRDIPYTIFEHLLDQESILRPKQKEAVDFTAQMIFEENVRAIAMIMPTSTGKTVILSRMIAGLKKDELIGHVPKRVVIVTDTKEGVINTKEKLKFFADIDAGVFYSDEKNLNSSVVVTTYNSWQSPDFPLDPEAADIVVLDEAHESISEARLEKLKQHKNALWMALTASPTYSEERSVLQHFALGYRMSVEDAVHYTLIASLRNVVLNSNIEVDLSEVRRSGKDFDSKTLTKVINTEVRNRIGAEYLLTGRHFDTGEPIRNIQGLVSCGNVKHAEDFAKQTNAMYNYYYPGQAPQHGFIRAVSGSTKNRRDILNWHRDGKIRHLAFADLLLQNYDDCGIGLMLNLRPSPSWVLNTQRGGRPGRLDPIDPGKISLVVDMVDKYKGEIPRKPVFYTHVIGSSAIITKEAQQLAKIKKEENKKYDVMDRSQIPEIQKIKEKIKLSIITDEESILALSAREEDYREKNDNDFLVRDIADFFGINISAARTGMRHLLLGWQLYNNDPEKYAIPPIVINTVKTNGNKLAVSISLNNIESFKENYLPQFKLPLKTVEDLNLTDLVEILGVEEAKIQKVLERLRAALNLYNANPEGKTKPEIEAYFIRNHFGYSELSINAAQLEKFKTKYVREWNAEEKTVNDLTTTDIALLTDLSNMVIVTSLNNLIAEWDKYNEDPSKNPKPIVPYKFVKARSGRIYPSISKSDFKEYQKKYLYISTLPYVTNNDYTIMRICRETGLSQPTVKREFDIIIKQKKEYELDITKAEIKPSIDPYEVRTTTTASWAISKEQYEEFKRTNLARNLLRYETTDDNDVQKICEKFDIKRSTATSALKKLKSDWKEYYADTENKKRPTVAFEEVRSLQIGSGSFKYVVKDGNMDEFKRDYLPSIKRDKTDNDMIIPEISKKTGLSIDIIKRSFKKIEKEWSLYNENPEINPKPKIALEFIAKPGGGMDLASIKEEDFDEYSALYLSDALSPKKLPSQAIANDVAAITGFPEVSIYKAFKKCFAAKADGIEDDVQIGKVKAHKQIALAIFAIEIPQLFQKYIPKSWDKFQQNQEEMLNKIDQYIKNNEVASKL